jgi:hypothetical protein
MAIKTSLKQVNEIIGVINAKHRTDYQLQCCLGQSNKGSLTSPNL